jgi:OOP family OmpA-OmpF porin
MLALTERVNNIENKMLDTDNDGVANYLDQEVTPAGTS